MAATRGMVLEQERPPVAMPRPRFTPIIDPTPVERLLLAMIRATDYGEVRISIIGGRIELASHLNTYKGATLEAAAARGAL